jgi:hypothetical protein
MAKLAWSTPAHLDNELLNIGIVEEHIIIVLVLLIYDIISNAVSGREKRLGREHAVDGSNA